MANNWKRCDECDRLLRNKKAKKRRWQKKQKDMLN